MSAAAAAVPCAACGAPSTLRCPECKTLNLSESVASFCGQACFKANWKQHKKLHNIPPPMTYKVIGHSFSPENGLTMTTREPLGRIVLASKSFAIGELCLKNLVFELIVFPILYNVKSVFNALKTYIIFLVLFILGF